MTKNNNKELAPIDSFKVEIMSRYNKELENYFKSDKQEMLKFMSWVVYSINKIPNLLKDKEGLINAVLELAQIGISPGIGQEAYILPFKGKSTAMIGYQGYVRLLYDAWISSIYWEIVYENDSFKISMGTNAGIEHNINPKMSKKQRWEIIGAYVIVKYKWEQIYKYMHKDDILEFRDKYSQSYKGKGKDYSSWNETNDPELNMWKKTILKQMMKYLPKTPQLQVATEVDNKEAPFDESFEVISGGEKDKEKAKKVLENLKSNKETNDRK